MKGILALRRKFFSGKITVRFAHQSLERAKFRDNFSFLNVFQTGENNGRSPKAPPYDQSSTEWNEEQEEFARKKAYKFHKEFLKVRGQ